MILRHSADGLYEIYDIGNNAILAGYQLGQVGTEWQFAGLGGFQTGHTSDMLLRNGASGAFEVYDIGNNNITNAASLGAVGLNWQVAGFGNFSSRGETDMLMRDSNSGAFEIYDIFNNQITGAFSAGAVGLNWRVAGIDSHGTESDLVLRDTNTGALEIYDIRNNQITSAVSLGVVGLDWQVVGFGNFGSQPGAGDMMMRNSNSGEFEVYDISDNQVTSATSLGAAHPFGLALDWQVVGFGPMNGAGTTGMVVRQTSSGFFEVYGIANNQLTTPTMLGQVGVGGFAPLSAMASMGSNAQLVQAMASFGGSSGAADGSNTVLPSADTQQQPLLTMPQHA
jgi:hypothetical protein